MKLYCSNCGKLLHLTRKALPSYGTIVDLDDIISNELAKYGGTFEVPFIYIEFEDEARANWFIMRWS